MATLILSTVGTAAFGPIGGAVGALIGQQIDGQIFKPKDREGPRLNDLSLQTSSYGTPIPKLFGTMRAAGTVIWATDLQEDRTREGGGKGRPSTTTYSYSASFAVALSARPINTIHRIWADGKLLRGAAGDFKSETGYRLYTGSEGQSVDPLLAAAEGIDGSPAYRSIALAVFEDFQLADYGNRIPSLTFEVEADTGPVALDTIVSELSDGTATADSAATLTGYAAHGDSVRGALESVFAALPHHLSDDDALLRFDDAGASPLEVPSERLGARPGETGGAVQAIERRPSENVPDEIAVRYYEPARDYQTGLQRARHAGPGRRAERIDLPATLSAARAKAIAEERLARSWHERVSAQIVVPWREMLRRPGDAVQLPAAPFDWRIASFELEKMALRLNLVRSGAGLALANADKAASGRAVNDPDLVHGPTGIRLLDLPALDAELDAEPRLLAAAAGPSPGWRHAALELSLGGGAFESLGQTAPPAIIGTAIDILAPGQSALIDDQASCSVELLHDDMWLESCSDDDLIAGVNLALVGDELIQFGSAVPLGNRRFLLSRLLRGRRGTEWAGGAHQAGEAFVLLEPITLRRLHVPLTALGTTAELLATGVGDSVPASDAITVDGRSVRPPAPVHLTAHRAGNGDLLFTWVRRSRLGWAWIDGGDIPLAEEDESWQLVITPDIGAARSVQTDIASYIYDAATQAADGAASASSFAIAVAQLGSLASSSPAASQTFQI